MPERVTCPQCGGGPIEWLHMTLRGGGCQSTVSCNACGWEETHLSGGRPEDRWGDAWQGVQALFVERIVALLARPVRDLVGVREALAEASRDSLHPYLVYQAAVAACPQVWAPPPPWPAVAPRSR